MVRVYNQLEYFIMGQAFTALFSMLASFLRAGEKLGNSAENLAGVAEEASAALMEEAREDRKLKLIAAQQKRAELEQKLMAKEAALQKLPKPAKAKEAAGE